jgi:hypothetical protein
MHALYCATDVVPLYFSGYWLLLLGFTIYSCNLLLHIEAIFVLQCPHSLGTAADQTHSGELPLGPRLNSCCTFLLVHGYTNCRNSSYVVWTLTIVVSANSHHRASLLTSLFFNKSLLAYYWRHRSLVRGEKINMYKIRC